MMPDSSELDLQLPEETDETWERDCTLSVQVSSALEAVRILWTTKDHRRRFGGINFCVAGNVQLLMQQSSAPRTYALDGEGKAMTAPLLILQRIGVRPSQRRSGLATAVLVGLAAFCESVGAKLMVQSVISHEMEALLHKMAATKVPYSDSSYIFT